MKKLFQFIAFSIIFSFSAASFFAQDNGNNGRPERPSPDRPGPERPSPNHSLEMKSRSRSFDSAAERPSRPHRDSSNRSSMESPNGKKPDRSPYLNYLGERKSISNEELRAKQIRCSTLTDNYVSIDIYFNQSINPTSVKPESISVNQKKLSPQAKIIFNKNADIMTIRMSRADFEFLTDCDYHPMPEQFEGELPPPPPPETFRPEDMNFDARNFVIEIKNVSSFDGKKSSEEIAGFFEQ